MFSIYLLLETNIFNLPPINKISCLLCGASDERECSEEGLVLGKCLTFDPIQYII